MKSGSNICVFAVGSMVEECQRAISNYPEFFNYLNITLINCRFIKPIDKEMIDKLIKSHNIFFSFEEGMKLGGFGSSIMEYFQEKNINKKLYIHGIDDKFTEHASRKELLSQLHLDSTSIYELIKSRKNG